MRPQSTDNFHHDETAAQKGGNVQAIQHTLTTTSILLFSSRSWGSKEEGTLFVLGGGVVMGVVMIVGVFPRDFIIVVMAVMMVILMVLVMMIVTMIVRHFETPCRYLFG